VVDDAPASGDPPSSGRAHREARRNFEIGRTAWPNVLLPFDSFARYFVRQASGAPLAGANAADLYLACACAEGDGEALAALERVLTSDVARALASEDSSQAFVDEMLQATREHLLVRRDREPCRIADYGGRASLKTWLCAVAVRLAISRRRRKGEQRHEQLSVDLRLAGGGPEFEYLRGRYKSVFEDAVRSAIEQLQAKERMLLRLNLVDGMSVDELGAMYKVGRSTAARWLANARRALLEAARQDLRARLQLSPEELESLAGDLTSQLEVSVLRLLARSSDSPGPVTT
jgi:RNA polymerase sigma-70 factor, ECF subfamily